LHRTLHKRDPHAPAGDGSYVLRYEESIEQLYDKIVVMANDSDHSEPVRNTSVINTYYPFHFLTQTRLHAGRQPTDIVFLGTPFLSARNVAPELYANILNRCLDYLRLYFGQEYRLVYRPHPRESAELTQLDLRGFEVDRSAGTAELYFLDHFQEIHAVFSVASTALRAALNFGIRAYSFLNLFHLPSTSYEYFTQLLGKVPQGFYLDSLSEQPPDVYLQPHAPIDAANHFRKAVELAVLATTSDARTAAQ
jgi:hypothetical protein